MGCGKSMPRIKVGTGAGNEGLGVVGEIGMVGVGGLGPAERGTLTGSQTCLWQWRSGGAGRHSGTGCGHPWGPGPHH